MTSSANDQRFGVAGPAAELRPQVYATLARLLKNGLVEVVGRGARRRARSQALRDHRRLGVTDIERSALRAREALAATATPPATKVVLALLTGREANDLLDAQRSEHLRSMRQLTPRAGATATSRTC